MHTRAERRGGHYLLHGTKQYITNAPIADVLLVYAVDPNLPTLSGISAFLVDASTPGLAVSSGFEKMGLRTSPMGEITLNRLPRSRGEPTRLGRGRDGDLQLVHGVGTELPFCQRRGRDAAAA